MVVNQVMKEGCPLLPSDVILAKDGTAIDDLISHCMQYIPTTTDDKIVNTIVPVLPRSHQEIMKIKVLRGDETLELDVTGFQEYFHADSFPVTESHRLLEDNIGLMNPKVLETAQLPLIMEEFKDTDGLIIDLRQYPRSTDLPYTLANYIVENHAAFLQYSSPFPTNPGAHLFSEEKSGNIIGSQASNFYSKNVVILMDERSQSLPEYTIMSLCRGENVTTMGSNSIGTDGSMTEIVLPGNLFLTFSGHGILTPDGSQTQRIGLTPDIEVYPTIQGIREGRDEVLEAAIQYLKDKQ